MSRIAAIVALLLAAGCGRPPAERPEPGVRPPAETSGVVRWRGGDLSFEELEARARRRLTAPVSGGIEEVLAGYLKMAEESAVVSLLEADQQAVARVEERWRPLLRALEKQALAQVYAAARLPRTQVTGAEVEAHYRDHPDDYRRPERREVLHVFKRDRPGADAMAALAGLRRRVLAGERFRDLAKEESDSEARLLERGLGWVQRGVLPPPLERVVFALPAGGVSEPVRVAGGGVLFYVTEVAAEERHALADVQRSIAERLAGDKIEALLADRELPEGAVVLIGDAVAPGLARAAPDEVVLAAGDYRLTAAGLAALLAEQAATAPAPLEPIEFYQALARSLRLALDAEAAGFPGTGEERQSLERALRLGRDAVFRRKLLEDSVRRRIDAVEPALRAFHAAEAERYSSPLGLKLRVLILTDLSDVASSMNRLEELHRRSAAGENVVLESAAAELGAAVTDLGWVDFAALKSLPQKVRIYLFGVAGTGLTIPFQLGDSLRLIEVVGRREPEPLAFEEVREAVARDYFARHGQEVYRQMVDEMLAAADFELDEAAIRARLRPVGG